MAKRVAFFIAGVIAIIPVEGSLLLAFLNVAGIILGAFLMIRSCGIRSNRRKTWTAEKPYDHKCRTAAHLRRIVSMMNPVKVIKEADVVVVGGGAGGFLAAIAAARTGAKTLVVEKQGYFGGSANTGLVGSIWCLIFGDRQVVKGIPWEFVERLIANGGSKGFTDFVVAPLQTGVYDEVQNSALQLRDIQVRGR